MTKNLNIFCVFNFYLVVNEIFLFCTFLLFEDISGNGNKLLLQPCIYIFFGDKWEF